MSHLRHLALAILLAAASSATAQESHTCSVKYLSADHAYLDAGSVDGLMVGSTITLTRDGDPITILRVEFVSEHSASCLLDPEGPEILTGDVGTFTAALTESSGPEPTTPVQVRERATRTRPVRSTADSPRLSGSVALQWEHNDDTSDADLDFDQPGLRYNLRVDHLARGFTLRARGSLRRDLRSRSYGPVSREEWRNRILEVSLSRLTDDDAWQMAFGRVGSRVTASVGPFDGAMVNRSMGGGWRLGVFSGLLPDWENAAQWTDDRVNGIVAHLQRGDRATGRLDMSIAGVSRHRDGAIDRDYLAMSGTWRRDRISLTNTAQIDWNRGWRGEATNSTLNLSNIMLSARYRPDDRWRLSVTFDDREVVRTWSNHTLPDSLFESAGRRGLRAGATWRDDRLSLAVDGGVRSDDRTDRKTASYSFRTSYREWPAPGLRLGFDVRGFDGPTSNGTSPSLRLEHRGRNGASSRIAVGRRSYTLRAFDLENTGRWLSLSHDRDLGLRWSAALETRWDGGDDTEGRRMFLELRRRF